MRPPVCRRRPRASPPPPRRCLQVLHGLHHAHHGACMSRPQLVPSWAAGTCLCLSRCSCPIRDPSPLPKTRRRSASWWPSACSPSWPSPRSTTSRAEAARRRLPASPGSVRTLAADTLKPEYPHSISPAQSAHCTESARGGSTSPHLLEFDYSPMPHCFSITLPRAVLAAVPPARLPERGGSVVLPPPVSTTPFSTLCYRLTTALL